MSRTRLNCPPFHFWGALELGALWARGLGSLCSQAGICSGRTAWVNLLPCPWGDGFSEAGVRKQARLPGWDLGAGDPPPTPGVCLGDGVHTFSLLVVEPRSPWTGLTTSQCPERTWGRRVICDMLALSAPPPTGTAIPCDPVCCLGFTRPRPSLFLARASLF